MSLPLKEIDRPLGLPGQASRRGGALHAGPGAWLGGLLALSVVAASGAVALRERPFRQPVAVAVPVAAPAAETATKRATAPGDSAKVTASPAAVNPADGPSIIKVQPESASGNGVITLRDPSALGQNLRVAHLPDRALIEESENGPLPVRGADGKRPFDAYARPWSGARGARVAIVIGGLGLSQTGTQQAIAKLPPEVTLGFAPQGNSLQRWMQEARQKGFELVLQVPLEPFDYPNVDPGRNTLTVDAEAGDNLARLHWALSRITNYTGVMNHMGARFVADREAMAPVMEELGRRGLLYLDDGSSARSTAPELALENRVPLASADATIDADRDRGAILARLDQLERTARAKGFALGTGSAFDVTVETVASWVSEAKKRGIEIVPVSAVAGDPERP